jgi:transcriptional regulator NrdR family protein
MIPCAFCGHEETTTTTTSWDSYFKTLRRHRLCLKCAFRWSTLEMDFDQMLYLMSLVQKPRKGSRRPQERS